MKVDGWTYTMSGTEKYELAPDQPFKIGFVNILQK